MNAAKPVTGGERERRCPRTYIYLMGLGMGTPIKELLACIPYAMFTILEVSMLAGKICNLVLNSVGLGRILFCFREPTSNTSI